MWSFLMHEVLKPAIRIVTISGAPTMYSALPWMFHIPLSFLPTTSSGTFINLIIQMRE